MFTYKSNRTPAALLKIKIVTDSKKSKFPTSTVFPVMTSYFDDIFVPGKGKQTGGCQ